MPFSLQSTDPARLLSFVFPEQTGLNSNFVQGQVNANASALSSADQFNSLASSRPQASPQAQPQAPQNFNPSNVFASMKNNKGILDASAGPQSQGMSVFVRHLALGRQVASDLFLFFFVPSCRQVQRPPPANDRLPDAAAASADRIHAAPAAARVHAASADRYVLSSSPFLPSSS